MITEFMPVQFEIFYNDRDGLTTEHSPLGPPFPERVQAQAFGELVLNSDDFRIATLQDGLLAAIGCGMRDLDDEDLAAIATDLGLELVGWVLR